MNIKPLGKRCWVEKDPAPTLSDIIAVTTETEKSVTGTVLAVGPECTHLEVGNRIMFPESVGVTQEVDKQEVFLISEDEIFATF